MAKMPLLTISFLVAVRLLDPADDVVELTGLIVTQWVLQGRCQDLLDSVPGLRVKARSADIRPLFVAQSVDEAGPVEVIAAAGQEAGLSSQEIPSRTMFGDIRIEILLISHLHAVADPMALEGDFMVNDDLVEGESIAVG